MLKRICALCLILAIVFSVIGVMPAFAAAADKIQLVYDLGILPEANETGLIPKGFTRADFAKSLYVMSRTDYASIISDKSPEEYATDIAANKNCNEIMAVLALGHMTTDENGKFNPGAAITKSDLIYSILSMLGYTPMANAQGGTESAYLAIATRLDLFKGVSISDPQKLANIEVAEIFANAMGIPFLDYEYMDWGDTCLWDRWNIRQSSGKILANSNMGILVEKTDVNYVNIGGTEYYTELLIENEILGANATYYIMSGDRGDEVVSIYIKDYGNTVTLEPTDIRTVVDNGTTLTVKTEDKKAYKVDKTGFLIMNGSATSPTAALFNSFESGSTTLIDSDNNGIYDIVNMTLLFQTVIKGVNASAETLATRFDNQVIDLSELDSYEVYIGKKAATLEDLKAGMPVGIACDTFTLVEGVFVPNFATANYINLYASNRMTTGRVSAKTADTFEIDGVAVPIGSGYERLVEEEKIAALQLGDYVDAYCDNFGKLTYYEPNTALGLKYGYLIKSGSDGVFTQTTQVKIFGIDGKFNIYSSGKNFILDGKKVESGATIYSIDSANDVDLTKRQLIRYRVEDDVLKEIDTKFVSSLETVENSLDETLAFDVTIEGNSKRRIRAGSIDRRYAFASDCIMFVDESEPDDTDPTEDMFLIQTVSNLGNTEEYIAGYDADENNELSCLVRYTGYGSSGATSRKGLGQQAYRCFVVVDIENSKDKDGNPGWTLTVAGENKKATYFASQDTLKLYAIQDADDWNGEALDVYRQNVNDFETVVKLGDIVRFTTNSLGEINYLEKVFDFDTYKDTYAEVPDRSGLIFGFVKLENVTDKNLIYTSGASTRYISRQSQYHGVVPLYHVNTGEVELIPFSQLPSAATGNNVKSFLRYYNFGVVQDQICYIFD